MCVRVCAFLCVVWAVCFLKFHLNMFACFVWDVLRDDVWFVCVVVFVCCA